MDTPLNIGRSIARELLDKGWGAFDQEELAYYDADIRKGEESVLYMIVAKIRGQSIGFAVAHQFLQEVGKGNSFITTDMTDSGHRQFQRLIDNGVIQKEPDTGYMAYPYRFRVIDEPRESLHRFVKNLESPEPPGPRSQAYEQQRPAAS